MTTDVESSGLSTLYEDQVLFAVSKPPEIHSVMLPEGGGLSIAEKLLAACPDLAAASDKPEDAGLIQRLDYETSGILIGAKKREIWERLREALVKSEIHKEYFAVCEGEFDSQTVSTYLGPRSRGSAKVTVFKDRPRGGVRALPAVTEFSLIKFFQASNISVMKVSAASARRHQIRAHAGFLKRPLLGDKLYGAESETAGLDPSAPKFLLHSYSARFIHPVTRQEISISAPFEHRLWRSLLENVIY